MKRKRGQSSMIDTEKDYQELIERDVSLADVQQALATYFVSRLGIRLKYSLARHHKSSEEIGFHNNELTASSGSINLDFACNLNQLSNNNANSDTTTTVINNYFKTYTKEIMVNFIIWQSVDIYFDLQTRRIINNWIISNFFNMKKFMAMLYIRKFCLLPFMLYATDPHHYQTIEDAVVKDKEWLDVLADLHTIRAGTGPKEQEQTWLKDCDIPWSEYYPFHAPVEQYNNQLNVLYLKQLIKINRKICPKYTSQFLFQDVLVAVKRNHFKVPLPCNYLKDCMQQDDETSFSELSASDFSYDLTFQIADLNDFNILYMLASRYQSWLLEKYLIKNNIRFILNSAYASQFDLIMAKLKELGSLTGGKYAKRQIISLNVFKNHCK